MKLKELQDALRKLRLSGVSPNAEINIGPVKMGERRKTVKGVAFDEVSVDAKSMRGRDAVVRNGIVYVVIGDL